MSGCCTLASRGCWLLNCGGTLVGICWLPDCGCKLARVCWLGAIGRTLVGLCWGLKYPCKVGCFRLPINGMLAVVCLPVNGIGGRLAGVGLVIIIDCRLAGVGLSIIAGCRLPCGWLPKNGCWLPGVCWLLAMSITQENLKVQKT